MVRTAILVDGGFYRKRARSLWGEKTAEERATELIIYCQRHLKNKDGNQERNLYRIFYYDCEPIGRKSVYNPITKKNLDLEKTETYEWSKVFLEELKKKRKVTLRLGVMTDDMYAEIRDDLFEHIDGLESHWKKKPTENQDS